MTESRGDVPVFGAPPALAPSAVRPSAYGLIADDRGRLAIVRTPEGNFLPGGGMDPGETVEETVARETLEECGLIVKVGGWSIRAIQHVYSESEQTHFEKRSTFVEATIRTTMAAGTEPDHDLTWRSAAQAARELTLPADGWAVDRWKSRNGPRRDLAPECPRG